MESLETTTNWGARRTSRLDRWPIQAAFGVAMALLLLPTTAYAGDKTAFDRALELGPVLGPMVAGLVALSFGVGTCATPCVYPMITITVSIFGAREAKSR